MLNVTDVTHRCLVGWPPHRPGDPLVLVNNAGIPGAAIIMRMKDDEWQSVIDMNLTALYRLEASGGMTKARWGRVINYICRRRHGNAGQSNYAS